MDLGVGAAADRAAIDVVAGDGGRTGSPVERNRVIHLRSDARAAERYTAGAGGVAENADRTAGGAGDGRSKLHADRGALVGRERDRGTSADDAVAGAGGADAGDGNVGGAGVGDGETLCGGAPVG